ncbi:hypothetical protein ACIQUS_12460 [Pseudomonas sp. NPDC090755]|uniref:hypothetical protein n=1 Tax=Pseudomonas sp. NPDC090755 TaxID=3364481 RepID=UPI003839DAFC
MSNGGGRVEARSLPVSQQRYNIFLTILSDKDKPLFLHGKQKPAHLLLSSLQR